MLRTAARGFRCPFAACSGLRCHSYPGLQQHLAASHSYHEAYCCEPGPGGEIEVYLRCKLAWADTACSFLPRQVAPAVSPHHALLPLLQRTLMSSHAFEYVCPRWQRALRAPGRAGVCPVDEAEALHERQAEEEAAAYWAAEQGDEQGAAAAAAPRAAAAEAPSSSAPLSSDFRPSESGAVAGSGSSGRAAAAAAAAAASRPKPRKGGRKAAVPVRRQSGGLTLLTRDGRPKFYHSRTCVAMTQAELLELAPGEGEGEGDLAEWQRDCRERLAERAELCAEQRDFMQEWNLHLHRQPLHADGDLPAALRAFAAAHAAQLVADGPFRRCLVAYLLHLWRFRLLTPSQLHELTSALPPLATS